MSYLVLARKYRPQNFAQMVGQEHVVQALGNALRTGRLHHAYMFTGTRGVGKTTVSRILAKSLNCVGPDGKGGITDSPCGVCEACSAIDSGRFVDYTELDAASNRGVEEVQSLLEQAAYKPVQGRFKVFMIDEVHMLSNTAFNAMLKTLEEPPEYLKFVLATTDPHKVPVTVLSRCLQFNLRPMAPETVLAHLQHVLEAEQVPSEPAALRLLSRAARGSMRDALSLTDQAIAFGDGRLQEAGVRQMLGTVDRSAVLGLIDALAQGDGRSVVERCEALRVHGLSAASTLEEMCGVLQRMAVYQLASAAADPADPEEVQIETLAHAMARDETQLLYSMCLQGRAELGLAPDDYAALTMVLLRLLAFKPEQGTHTQTGATPRSAVALEKKSPEAAKPQAAAVNASAVAQQPAASAQTPPWEAQPVASAPVAPTPARSAPAPVAATPADAAPAQPPGMSRVRIVASEQASSKSNFVAMPVRAQPEAGPRSQAKPAQPSQPVALETTPEGDFWFGIVQQLIAADAVTALTRELALQSQLLGRDKDVWTLRVESESLCQAGIRDKLQTALANLGHAVHLAMEIGVVRDSCAKRNAVAQAKRQQQAEQIILSNPFVQAMMRDYGAKIVSGSIRPT